MKIITQQKIGSNIKHSQGFISEVIRGKKYTTKIEIAKAIAEAYGGAPIDYVHPDRRQLYLKAYPYLSKARKQKVQKNAR
jgi:hypothetical protein